MIASSFQHAKSSVLCSGGCLFACFWKNPDSGVSLSNFWFVLITCLPADFGVSAKNTKTLQRRDSFIGTPYW